MGVRFGIIGCSSVARRRFLPALQKSTVARLERIGSRDAAKGAEFAKTFGCAKAGSYDAVLTDPDVDAVYISTPGAFHEEWSRKAAQAKKHVLCEKPAFSNYVVAVEMVKLCRAQGVRLMEGYMFRYHPQHTLVKRLVGEGKIGAVRYFEGAFCVPPPPANDFRYKAELGGGVFRDSAGYPVAAAMLQLSSRPTSVFCQTHIDKASGVDTGVSMQVAFSGGEVAQLTAAYGTHYRSKYSLLGAAGRIEVERAFSVNHDQATTVVLETAKGMEKFSLEPVDQFQLMIDDFARQLGGTAERHDFEGDLLRQHAFMDAAWRSTLEQRPVLLEDSAT